MIDSQTEQRVCVRIKGELAGKVQRWNSEGYLVSEIVRLALSLLPNSPGQLHASQSVDMRTVKVHALHHDFSVKARDEKSALRALQDW